MRYWQKQTLCLTIVENEKKKRKFNNFYTDTVCALSRLQLKVEQREDLREELMACCYLLGPTNARVPRAYEDLKMALEPRVIYTGLFISY